MRLRERLDFIIAELAEIKADHKYHIKRADLLERDLEDQRESLRNVEKHVEFVRRTFRLVTALTALALSIKGLM